MPNFFLENRPLKNLKIQMFKKPRYFVDSWKSPKNNAAYRCQILFRYTFAMISKKKGKA